MTANKLSHQKPLLYGLIGLTTGAVLASLIVYNVRPKPPSSVSLSTVPGNTAAREVISPQSSPTSAPTAIPGMPGMMAQADQHFIVMMIPHHEAAVKMAKDQIANGKNEALKVMAQKMIVEQNNEIDLFKKWLANQK